jgi:exopolysaccharide biosynthesis WecB/TagA/CpsF family protein
VARATLADLRVWFHEAARARGAVRVVHFANAHTLNLAWNDPGFRDVLARADVVLNDGVGLDLYARMVGVRFERNFNGTDLVPALLEDIDPADPLRVFLFGGVPGRAEDAARVLEARFPGVLVVGTRDGYAHEGAIAAINETSPDLLLVGMGNPLQERWVESARHHLDVGVAMGVGALIDFLSGRVARAPRWMRAARLEWLYRLAREPQRLFRRYVVGNPAFLARAAAYALGPKR